MGRRLVYELHLPEATPSNNAIKGMHFQVYKNLRNAWQRMVIVALDGQRPGAPIARTALEVERHCSGSLDWDNAYGGLKPLLDCLVAPSKRSPDGLGLVLDDNPKCMPDAPVLRQLPAKRGQGFTLVRIYELDD